MSHALTGDGGIEKTGNHAVEFVFSGPTSLTFPTSGTLSTTGGSSDLALTIVASPSYTVLLTDCIVACQVSATPATPFSVVLPAAAPAGQIFYIKDYTGNAVTNQINVTAASGNIDGNPSGAILFTAYASQGYFSDGTDYYII